MLRVYLQKALQAVKWAVLQIKQVFMKIFSSWPKVTIAVIASIVILYYPLGGLFMEKINRNISYEVPSDFGKGSFTLDMMSGLINREVNENIWSPNLPIFFPSYFLDNMPNFQTSIIGANAVVAKEISANLQCQSKLKEAEYMKNAAELLAYPADVWLFSSDNKLKIAPSSSNQYRKARRRINEFNKSLISEECFWQKTPQNFAMLISKIRKDLTKSSEKLEVQVQENSLSWVDYKADDVFYFAQGKAYAYAMLMKSLGHDYKSIILSKNLYPEWTRAIKALDDAAELKPSVVHNGNLNAQFIANHLIALNYYLVKAENILTNLRGQLLEDK